jgi:DNA invertase Pin-like site-specific DNA recombinase
VRIVGYVREAPVLGDSEIAYAQKETVRRWSAEAGHQLISVCEDLRVPGSRADRDGYRALLDIVASGHADAVLVAELTALSPDKVLQEVMIEDLRRHGVVVLSANATDMAAMTDASHDQTRMVVRDIVGRVHDYVAAYGPPPPRRSDPRVVDLREKPRDVVVELIRSGERHRADNAAQAARPTA